MPDFKIVISATDKATATVRKVNDAMAKVTRPFEDAHKSFKRFDAALGDNLVVKGLGKMSSAALGAARSVGHIAAPIAAITGVASISGVTLLADRWAKFGRSVSYASQQVGVSTSKLQQYQGMATLAGVSSDSMTAGLEGLGTTMEDARWGRNQGALMMLNRLGIGLKKTKDGAFDVNAEFMAVAKVMTSDKLKNNPWAQSLVANTLSMGGLLPILRQGEEGMKKYQAMQARLGYISSPAAIKNANDFALSLAGLKISAEGLGQSIMDKAMPAFRPFIDELSTWIGKNRELFATNVASSITTIADALKNVDWKNAGAGITGFFNNTKGSASDLKIVLDSVVKALDDVRSAYDMTKYMFRNGGLVSQGLGVGGQFANAQNAAYAADHGDDPAFVARRAQLIREGRIGSLDFFKKSAGWLERVRPDAAIAADYEDYQNNIAAGTFMDPASYRPADGSIKGIRGGAKLSNAAVAYFRSQGWTLAQASGIAGNISSESGFNPAARGDFNKRTGQYDAYGIGQWHKDRQNNFAKWAGHSIIGSSLEEQERFMQYEITQGTERSGGNKLRNAENAYDAGAIFSRYVERPGDAAGEANSRGNLASSIAQRQGPYSAGVATASASSVHVQVDLKNAPPGTTAKATTKGNATSEPPRIGYSAVGAGA